jgi:hypothetical protein
MQQVRLSSASPEDYLHPLHIADLHHLTEHWNGNDGCSSEDNGEAGSSHLS